MPITYRDAGVDIDAGDDLVRRIAPLARATRTPHVVADVGGFASLCRVPPGMSEPLLVSGTDGVGTKLKVAFATGRHDTIGIDLVAMCVNDIVTVGAEPLFFLDYFATGKLSVDVAESVVSGIAEGCRRAGCALVGGETAELPGMYADGEYDLAGFAVGVVERAAVLGPDRVHAGDVLVGVASSGLHSNGYSLARRVVEVAGLAFADPFFGEERSVGEVLLEPTTIYAPAGRQLREALGEHLHALCHVTGGGLVGNVPRVLPKGLHAHVDTASWSVPPVFRALQEAGPVDVDEMRRTFNLGVGLVGVVAPDAVDEALSALAAAGQNAWRMGTVESGERGATLH